MTTTTAKKAATSAKRMPAKKTVAKKTTPRKPSPQAKKTVTRQAIEEASDSHPVLVAAVPDMSVAKRYIGRSFTLTDGGKSMTDYELLDYCYDNGMNLLIEGPTGPGKTMFSRAWAATRNKQMARVTSYSGTEPSQLFGKYVPDRERGGFRWIDGSVTHIVRYGGLILINEGNFIPERISTVLFGLLDDNREITLFDKDGEIVRAHRGAGKCWCNLSDDDCNDRRVVIVMDMNPGYSGTRALNAALRNRFAIQLVWDYDPEVESQLVANTSLRTMAQSIRDQAVAASFTTPISTNMLMEFEKLTADLGIDFAIMNFINHFKESERDPVRLLCDTHKPNILSDYADPDDDDDETDDDLGDDTASEWDEVHEFVFAEEN